MRIKLYQKQFQKNGFTLIELIIVIIILGIVVAGSSELLSQGFRSFFVGQGIINSQWQAQIALERMERDLRAIAASTTIAVASNTQVTFTDMNGVNLTYRLEGSQLKRNAQTLSDNISNLTFSYFDAVGTDLCLPGPSCPPSQIPNIRYIGIAFDVVSNNTNLHLTTTVHPWNLF